MRNGYGVAHGDEQFVLFNPLGSHPEPMGRGPITERDKFVSEMMLTFWTNFIATQNPTPQAIPKSVVNKFYAALEARIIRNLETLNGHHNPKNKSI